MPKTRDQKKKILCIMEILLNKTDENHPLTTQQLIKELGCYGIEAERKSIYTDIEALTLYGLDIINKKGKPSGYYIASREFELPELKLLVDAVQSSKFITKKKSEELIKKLERLTNKYEASQLQRQVYVTNRIKTMNESIYYNVDKIHVSIYGNCQIKFQYFEWNLKKEMNLRKEGAFYQISPWALVWDDENYYMIGYDSEVGLVKHYRVDKMLKISVVEAAREGKETFQSFDTAQYSKKTFGMFGGREEDVYLRCDNKIVGVILDRFGMDVVLRSVNECEFEVRVNVAVSNQFYGWITGLAGAVRIQKPDNVAKEYRIFLTDLLNN